MNNKDFITCTKYDMYIHFVSCLLFLGIKPLLELKNEFNSKMLVIFQLNGSRYHVEEKRDLQNKLKVDVLHV